MSRPNDYRVVINDYGGDSTAILNASILWRRARNPWNVTGSETQNSEVYVVSCITNNRDIHQKCAGEVEGDFLDRNDTVTSEMVGDDGWTNWYRVYRGQSVVSDDGRFIWDDGRERLDEWESCFNSERGEENRVQYFDDLRNDSVVHECQMRTYGFGYNSGLPVTSRPDSAGKREKVVWLGLLLGLLLPIVVTL